MRPISSIIAAGALGLGTLMASGAAHAAQCGNDGSGFSAWVEDFKAEAQSRGVSARVAAAALSNVSYDRSLIAYDRTQRPFKLSLEQFIAKRAPASLISQAKKRWASNRALFDRVEAKYGVEAPVILAIWGMETAFGAIQGKKNVFNGLATLAYDCRRTEKFQAELIAAMQLVDSGQLSMSEMRGAEHGEIGQGQFLPTSYQKYAVDGDGDGRSDMVRSSADTIASIANYLRQHGWQRGGGFDQYGALAGWNSSSVYQKAIAYAANKIAE